MKIAVYKEPVSYIIIDDVYDEQDLFLIHNEIDQLYPYFNGPETTGSAINKNNVYTKKNSGLWLDNFFRDKRSQSNILMKNRKIFSEEFYTSLKPYDYIYAKFLEKCSYDVTLVSYYETGGHYKPHTDNSAITAITWFHKKPKNFTGGDFYLSDFNIKVEPIDNRCIMLFGIINHHVTDVEVNNIERPRAGRFAMSQFINIKP
jgi:hypothetical protein